MSVTSLRTQIKEDHLTCAICCNGFTKPKALPCLHTFCESCLRDYIFSRGYDSTGSFPCPICRIECRMPSEGVVGFPTNNVDMSRPVPKPRRSIGISGDHQINGPGVSVPPYVNVGTNVEGQHCNSHEVPPTCKDITPTAGKAHGRDHPKFETSSGAVGFELGDGRHELGTSVDYSPPPPYSSVADSQVCSYDDGPEWMFVPRQDPSQSANNNHRGSYTYPASQPPHAMPPGPMYPSAGNGQPTFGGSWNVQNLPPVNEMPPHIWQNEQFSNGDNPQAALYPSVPPDSLENRSCSENMILSFGKQGPTARDFIKPLGLAVSSDGQYVISDNGGDQNRIMIFNSGGEITTAFKCGAKLKNIAVTQNDEIIASIDKHVSAFRRFTMGGQLKGEFGKFFTYEELGGIAELKNQGIVLTGIEGHCVYTLTPQMKLCKKFGRKGNGDGYFITPSFVTVDSKNHIIITDETNSCIQMFNSDGKFKQKIGSEGPKAGQLQAPQGVCVDSKDNIIVADSGNFRVEVFSPGGRWLCSVIKDTNQLGESVKPVNVAVTPTGKVAVLLRGPYFAQVRVFSSRHQQIPQEAPASNVSSIWSDYVQFPDLWSLAGYGDV